MPVIAKTAKVYKGGKYRYFTAKAAAKNLAREQVKEVCRERLGWEAPWSDADVEQYHRAVRFLSKIHMAALRSRTA